MALVSDLLRRVRATIDRHGMLHAGQRVGVAVSGGADSVCLLHVLRELAPQWELRLHVLHLNHRLRGEESDQDAEFVRRLAAELELPATIGEADLAGSRDNLEQAARHARLEFFRAANLDRVAVGHTRSDQAETVLFRFLRGSGTAGLAGIRPVTSDGIVRPLLDVDRADVEQFLRERSIPWRDDSTNAAARFARNRIRHDLLPQLAREWNPEIAARLAQTADWAQAEEAYWDQELDRLAADCLQEKDGAVLLRAPRLAELPVAAGRRLVRRAIGRTRGDLRGIDFGHAEAVLQMSRQAQGWGHATLPGVCAVRSFEWIRLARPTPAAPPYRLPAPVPGTVSLAGACISLELIEKTETFQTFESVYNGGMGCVDWHRLPSCLEFRNWMPGDRYQPSGSTGTEKIKTLFQRARIPVWERRNWPVLWDGSEIVWARRFGPSAQFAANSTSRVILQIRESPAG